MVRYAAPKHSRGSPREALRSVNRMTWVRQRLLMGS